MNTNKLEALNTELRDQINKYTERLNALSVYHKDELYEKGQLLSNLQLVENNLSDTLNTLKSKITEQKQVLEKYMREAEESFNAVRQNIYNTNDKKVIKKEVAKQVPILKKSILVSEKPKPLEKTPIMENKTLIKAQPKSDTANGWTEVSRKKAIIPKLVKREVAPDLFIQAVTVSNMDECHNNLGWWCWCPEQQRFGISINNKVYAGNTTIIHSITEQPVKFFEHRRCDKVENWVESDYYIPIEKNPESHDLRHFTNKMKFVPASRTPEKYETYCYRLGSKDTLKDDVMTLKPEDYRLFSDLNVNFLLSLTAASVEMDRRNV